MKADRNGFRVVRPNDKSFEFIEEESELNLLLLFEDNSYHLYWACEANDDS